MSTFSWDDDDTMSEYDMVAEEAAEVEELAAQQAQEPVIVEADEEEIEEILEEAAFDLDEEEASVIYNARIRLEQAKLYEMLINHDLFEGVDVDARAIAIVRNEIKHYIVKRLEILMGLREPATVQQQISSEFNSVEADFLRQLAAKGTKGRSLEADEEEYEEPVKTGGLNPVGRKIKSSALKPLVRKKKVSPKQPPEEEVQVAKKPREIRKTERKTTVPRKKITQAVAKTKAKPKAKAKKPTKTVERKVKVESSLGKRDLRPDEIEALAREDMELMKNRKPLHKMTAKEKAAEIARVNARNPARPKPNTRVAPPMDESQLFNKYTMEQAKRGSGVGGKQNQFDSIMTSIANNMAMKKSQEE